MFAYTILLLVLARPPLVKTRAGLLDAPRDPALWTYLGLTDEELDDLGARARGNHDIKQGSWKHRQSCKVDAGKPD